MSMQSEIEMMQRDIAYQLDRMGIWGEEPSGLQVKELLTEIQTGLGHLEDLEQHDDCYSPEAVSEMIAEERQELTKRISELEGEITALRAKPRRTRARRLDWNKAPSHIIQLDLERYGHTATWRATE